MVDHQILRAVSRFADKKIAIIGDVMLDHYVYGNALRVSPEAPVLVLHKGNESAMLGGAGNVAATIAALGATPLLIGTLGEDDDAQKVKALCEAINIPSDYLLSLAGRITSRKTRLIANSQHVVRVDDERTDPLDTGARAQVMAVVDKALQEHHVDIVILSDYGKGMLTGGMAPVIIERAQRAGLPVIVDPKGKDFEPYRGAGVVTPNLKELNEAAGVSARSDDEIATAARGLMRKHDFGAMLVTRGEHGMSVVEGDAAHHVSTFAREVFDVSGAGDTAVAAFSLGVACGYDTVSAAQIANIAAGVVVGKRGTAQVSREELAIALHDAGIADAKKWTSSKIEAAILAKGWQAQNCSVGFTNGCFDILHAGHISILNEAKRNCDRLIVGLNSDRSVERLKGEGRPINKAEDRAAVLAAMNCVDLVVIFPEDTPAHLIETLAPDVLVKGKDYKADEVVGADFVTQRGGRLVLVDLVEGYSTTALMERLATTRTKQLEKADH